MISYIAHTSNGVFAEDKRVYVDKRLPGMEYSMSGIIIHPWGEQLVSYETIVAEKTSDGWVHVFGLFSPSTRKHLSYWGRRIGIPYQVLRECYELGQEINTNTGKRRKADDAPVQTVGVKP